RPGELGLSAMHDLKLTREFADIARQEWAAVGIRKGYQYMADVIKKATASFYRVLMTQPRSDAQRLNDNANFDPGYGVGVITVLENAYNQQLRAGRRWETVGWLPQKQAVRNEVPFMDGGVSAAQPEDWNVNVGLRVREVVRSYTKLKTGQVVRNVWPNAVVWSKLKTDTERFDSFRRYPAENIYLLDGEGGAIVGLHALPIGLYAVQNDFIVQIAVDERQVDATETGLGLQIASGREVGPHRNLSRTTGASSTSHTWTANTAFYWMDRRTGELMRFAQDGIAPLAFREGVTKLFPVGHLANTEGIFDPLARCCYVIQVGLGRRIIFDEELNAFGPTTTHNQGSVFPGVQGVLSEYPPENLSPGSVRPPVPTPILGPVPYVPTPTIVIPTPTGGGLSTNNGTVVASIGTVYPATAQVTFRHCPYPGQFMRWQGIHVAMSATLYAQLVTVVLNVGGRGRTIQRTQDWWQYRHGKVWIPFADEDTDDDDEGTSLLSDVAEVVMSFSIPTYSAADWLLSADFTAYIATRI
ncbi:MAG: hypothetical protein EOO39_10545, partial [Cytophagaceae bacterium]